MLSNEQLAIKYNLTLPEISDIPAFPGNYRNSFSYPWRIVSDFHDQQPKVLPDGIVVDAGCSYGCTSMSLCSMYPNHAVVGIEIEADRLMTQSEIADEFKSQLSFKSGDLFHLDRLFGPSTVSCVYMMNNLTYLISESFSSLGSPLIMNLLKNRLYHILVEGGYFCLSGAGERVEDFAWAVFQKSEGKLKAVSYNEGFNTSPGLICLCEAFDIKFRYLGT